jgi:hypothetical protein
VRFAPLEQYGNACVAMANLDNDPNLTGQRWAPSGSEFIHLKMSADNQSVDFVNHSYHLVKSAIACPSGGDRPLASLPTGVFLAVQAA